jgi:hypothetical protein
MRALALRHEPRELGFERQVAVAQRREECGPLAWRGVEQCVEHGLETVPI